MRSVSSAFSLNIATLLSLMVMPNFASAQNIVGKTPGDDLHFLGTAGLHCAGKFMGLSTGEAATAALSLGAFKESALDHISLNGKRGNPSMSDMKMNIFGAILGLSLCNTATFNALGIKPAPLHDPAKPYAGGHLWLDRDSKGRDRLNFGFRATF